jgi:hypothetical protein
MVARIARVAMQIHTEHSEGYGRCCIIHSPPSLFRKLCTTCNRVNRQITFPRAVFFLYRLQCNIKIGLVQDQTSNAYHTIHSIVGVTMKVNINTVDFIWAEGRKQYLDKSENTSSTSLSISQLVRGPVSYARFGVKFPSEWEICIWYDCSFKLASTSPHTQWTASFEDRFQSKRPGAY